MSGDGKGRGFGGNMLSEKTTGVFGSGNYKIKVGFCVSMRFVGQIGVHGCV